MILGHLTDLLIAETILLIVLLGTLVLVTLLFFQALHKVLDNTDRAHNRYVKQLDGVLDRIMAEDFQAFKTYQAIEHAEAGGQELPDEDAWQYTEEKPWTGFDHEQETMVLPTGTRVSDHPTPEEMERSR